MKNMPVPIIVLMALISLSLPACHKTRAEHKEEPPEIVVTSPLEKDVIITESYVCQIHSRRHIEVCALKGGYLEETLVKEGQAVTQGAPMFKILPVLYQASLSSAQAEAQMAQIELSNTKSLFESTPPVVSIQQVKMAQAKLAKAQAEVKRAQAEMNFAVINAPYDGIIDRFHVRNGSLVEEGDLLTTLSDNSVMWVYFNVPEARYLEFLAHRDDENYIESIELELANGKKFPHPGKLATIEADFNNETGTVAFRADFPNPEHLLRHHQTGNVLIHHKLENAIVIPQRATFEILDHRYVYVVGTDGVVHQRMIVVQEELEDIYVVQKGLAVGDKIVLQGIRHVRDGEKAECEFRDPKEVLSDMKYEAE